LLQAGFGFHGVQPAGLALQLIEGLIGVKGMPGFGFHILPFLLHSYNAFLNQHGVTYWFRK
jgi:hypothetical protein